MLDHRVFLRDLVSHGYICFSLNLTNYAFKKASVFNSFARIIFYFQCPI
jgi:hypothetical protein